jgi:dUTP pyrophosphatase
VEAQIRPRSSLAIKRGLTVPNSPGTVDSTYRGEIKVGLINLGQHVQQIQKGERIAQMVFAPVLHAEFTVVDEFDETKRGEGGFGSTGTV